MYIIYVYVFGTFFSITMQCSHVQYHPRPRRTKHVYYIENTTTARVTWLIYLQEMNINVTNLVNSQIKFQIPNIVFKKTQSVIQLQFKYIIHFNINPRNISFPPYAFNVFSIRQYWIIAKEDSQLNKRENDDHFPIKKMIEKIFWNEKLPILLTNNITGCRKIVWWL